MLNVKPCQCWNCDLVLCYYSAVSNCSLLLLRQSIRSRKRYFKWKGVCQHMSWKLLRRNNTNASQTQCPRSSPACNSADLEFKSHHCGTVYAQSCSVSGDASGSNCKWDVKNSASFLPFYRIIYQIYWLFSMCWLCFMCGLRLCCLTCPIPLPSRLWLGKVALRHKSHRSSEKPCVWAFKSSHNWNLSLILNDTENTRMCEKKNLSHLEMLSSALCWNIKFNSSNGFINSAESFRKTFDHMYWVIMAF